MAEASNGGWVRRAASDSASVRLWAASMATRSTGVGSTPSKMCARASSTVSGGDITPARPGRRAGLCDISRKGSIVPVAPQGLTMDGMPRPGWATMALSTWCGACFSPLTLVVRHPIRAGPAASLLDEADAFQHHGFVCGFEHVVDREASYRDGG